MAMQTNKVKTMTEKIEWYKEVLELDPGSKLFFPLARLLVEDQCQDEAIDVLRRGLERHEEFLEARLYLIELLHTSGKTEDCERQVHILSEKFSAYAVFWQAWAACLANVNTDHDTVAVLRFLALVFSHGDVSLLDVFMRGLATYEKEAEQKHLNPISNRQKEISPVNADTNQTISINDAHIQLSETIEEISSPSPISEPDISANEIEDDHVETNDSGMTAIQLDNNNTSVSANDFSTDGAFSEEMPLSTKSPENVSEDIDLKSTSALLDNSTLDSAVVDDELKSDVAIEAYNTTDGLSLSITPITVSTTAEADTTEEQFSLRTRSMAEVLAEQGDIRGALDIYHELASAAVAPEEIMDLHQRIATLNSRLGSIQTITAPAPETARGKDRLISMLEALAERVEARAQQN